MSEIVIHDSKLTGRRLISRVTVSKRLEKYLKSFELFANYDTDIYANTSVLNIPLLSTVLPLAWLTGADIFVEELDKRYKEAMDALKHEFMRMYPKAPFTTNIMANSLVDNKIENINSEERTAQLFSGGVDSTYTLITNIDLKPRLIMIWGLEGYPYPYCPKYWEMIRTTYSEFAKRKGLIFNFIETNAREILNEKRIEHDFHELIYEGTFLARLQHSLVLLPLAAPLSIGRFNHLLIAASCDSTYPYDKHPWASQPRTDEKIAWASLQVKHDGYIHRSKKIMNLIKEYLKDNKLLLRVCLDPEHAREKLNCSSCEKCFRTIVPLVLAGIDPNNCGFKVDNSTFKLMKSMFEKKKVNDMPQREWRALQAMIPDKIENDLYGSREFFEWFKGIDLNLTQKDVWIYRDLYNRLPYSISRWLDKFFYKIGIDIHEHSPIHPTR